MVSLEQSLPVTVNTADGFFRRDCQNCGEETDHLIEWRSKFVVETCCNCNKTAAYRS